MKCKLLMLEVTRRCNETCKHCMRGEPQPVDMSTGIISEIFNDIKEVDELVLTGGEPTLVPSVIENIVRFVKFKNVKVGHFKVIIGHINNTDAFDALQKLHEITLEPKLNLVMPSFDKFHNKLSKKKIAELCTKYEFFMPSERNDFMPDESSSFDNSILIGCGRAKELNETNNPTYLNGFDFDIPTETLNSVLYIGANGEILSDCDLSYDLMQIHNFGNVVKNGLYRIIKLNAQSLVDLQEIEIESANGISFQQYWSSLTEDKCGDWFGYVFDSLYGRNLPGFGVFDTIERHPKLKNNKELEDFIRLTSFRSSTVPLWIKPGDRRFIPDVKLKLVDYLRVLTSMVYAANPFLELIDIYYQDLPYSAGKKLHPFIEKLIASADKAVGIVKQ